MMALQMLTHLNGRRKLRSAFPPPQPLTKKDMDTPGTVAFDTRGTHH